MGTEHLGKQGPEQPGTRAPSQASEGTPGVDGLPARPAGAAPGNHSMAPASPNEGTGTRSRSVGGNTCPTSENLLQLKGHRLGPTSRNAAAAQKARQTEGQETRTPIRTLTASQILPRHGQLQRKGTKDFQREEESTRANCVKTISGGTGSHRSGGSLHEGKLSQGASRTCYPR